MLRIPGISMLIAAHMNSKKLYVNLRNYRNPIWNANFMFISF